MNLDYLIDYLYLKCKALDYEIVIFFDGDSLSKLLQNFSIP